MHQFYDCIFLLLHNVAIASVALTDVREGSRLPAAAGTVSQKNHTSAGALAHRSSFFPCSGAGIRTGPHHCRGGDSDGSGRCMPPEPLQSLHTFLHQSPQPEPETGGRAAAGKCVGLGHLECPWGMTQTGYGQG